MSYLRRKSKIVSLPIEAEKGRGRVSCVLIVHQDSGLTLHLTQMIEGYNCSYTADKDLNHTRAK